MASIGRVEDVLNLHILYSIGSNYLHVRLSKFQTTKHLGYLVDCKYWHWCIWRLWIFRDTTLNGLKLRSNYLRLSKFQTTKHLGYLVEFNWHWCIWHLQTFRGTTLNGLKLHNLTEIISALTFFFLPRSVPRKVVLWQYTNEFTGFLPTIL